MRWVSHARFHASGNRASELQSGQNVATAVRQEGGINTLIKW